VLTGGPSAGKSSALALLRDRLTVRGFQVLTVPENATQLLANSDGFQPEWAGTFSQVCMQRIFLEYQLAQEEAFGAFARLHPAKRGVLLLDCCTLNSKVYLSDDQWEQVLSFPGKPRLTEEELLGRYDLVIHMVTCADLGNYEWGPGSNNPGRYHTPEQAKETDERCLQVFSAHPQTRVVPHFPKFDEKIGKVLDFVNDALHVEGLAGTRHRIPVRISSFEQLLSRMTSPASSSSSSLPFIITSTFLDDQMQHSMRRRARVPFQLWLDRFDQFTKAGKGQFPVVIADDHVARPSWLNEAADLTFERRTQVQALDPTESFLKRKVVQETEYYATLETVGSSASTITKYMLSFVEGSQYYELLFFAGSGHGLILDLCEGATLPSCLLPELPPQQQLEAAASTAAAGPCTSSPDGPKNHAAKRPRRALGRHSTEAAALFCSSRESLNEPDPGLQ
jgi:hypothetical protein